MKFFKKDELRLLWPFYLDALFIGMLFLLPPFSILYFREIGLSLTQIGFLASSSALAMILFEIPTGAIADIFGRKISVILGAFLSGIIVFSIFFFNEFYLILILFFFWGAFGTLMSGADEAWIVDLLKHKKRKNLIHEYYTKRHSFISTSLLVSGIIGAILVKQFGLGIIWPVTGGAMILTSFVLFFGKEYFVKKKQHIKERTKELFSHTKKSINYSLKHQAILFLVIISVIMIFLNNLAGDITWYPFLQDLGLQEYWFGYLYSSLMFLGIFIPYFSKPLIKKLGGYKNYFFTILFLMMLFLFSVGFINTLIFALIVFLLFMSMYDFYIPINRIYFQNFIPGKMRATIGSFGNMVAALGVIIASPLAGFFADNIGPQNTIFISSFILIPMIILYSKIKDSNREN
ncbi:hypothetical protein CMI40_02465 [Candidatus Pacearchaeota archaeon]|jgi:MFS family permease|nr:hypothetical protein [Candidatus Pacearchaeota archaeon]